MAKHGEKTKETIYQTALTLFHNHGYEKTTLLEICKATGISKNTFYYYFNSKDDILIELYRRSSALSVEQMASIISGEDYYDQLWQIDQAYISFLESAGHAITRHLLAINLTGSKAKFEIEHLGKEITTLELGLIRKAQQERQIQNLSSPQELLTTKNEILYGAVMRWCMLQPDEDVLTQVKKCYDILFLPTSKGRNSA